MLEEFMKGGIVGLKGAGVRRDAERVYEGRGHGGH